MNERLNSIYLAICIHGEVCLATPGIKFAWQYCSTFSFFQAPLAFLLKPFRNLKQIIRSVKLQNKMSTSTAVGHVHSETWGRLFTWTGKRATKSNETVYYLFIVGLDAGILLRR